MQVYESLVPPPIDKNGVLLLLPDGFGHVTHNFILADDFAQVGWHVVVPDYYEEQPWSEEQKQKLRDLDFPAWLNRHNHQHVSRLLEELVVHLCQHHPATTFVGVGYCFGGKHVMRLAQAPLTAAVAFHPSFVEAADMDGVNIPLYAGLAACDDMVPASLAADLQGWSTSRMDNQSLFTLEIYPNVGHGFAARPDTKDGTVKEQYIQAFTRTVAFLAKHANALS
ncbi:dienelactone hydrolase [Paraphoma chrysanthemicola]|nr:dienelactone hydrolase [Paraphoma chrysanthemicola]